MTAWQNTAFDGGPEPGYESLNDVLRDVVRALGGSKNAGVMLFPEKGVEGAARLLLACMDDNRAERLSPHHLLRLLRLARDRGCHVGMEFIASECGYTRPGPVDTHDQFAELQRQLSRAMEQQRHIMDKLQQTTEQMQELQHLRAQRGRDAA